MGTIYSRTKKGDCLLENKFCDYIGTGQHTPAANEEGRRNKNGDVYDYMDSAIIIVSVAEVERLWRIDKYVATVNRWLATPMIFEALVFLKVNERYYDTQS